MLQDFLQRWKERRQKFKDAQEEQNIQRKLQERQLSSNERELNGYLKEEREKQIKNAVEQFRKKKNDELWHKNVIKQKNLFKGQKSIMRNDRKQLRQRSMFMK